MLKLTFVGEYDDLNKNVLFELRDDFDIFIDEYADGDVIFDDEGEAFDVFDLCVKAGFESVKLVRRSIYYGRDEEEVLAEYPPKIPAPTPTEMILYRLFKETSGLSSVEIKDVLLAKGISEATISALEEG